MKLIIKPRQSIESDHGRLIEAPSGLTVSTVDSHTLRVHGGLELEVRLDKPGWRATYCSTGNTVVIEGAIPARILAVSASQSQIISAECPRDVEDRLAILENGAMNAAGQWVVLVVDLQLSRVRYFGSGLARPSLFWSCFDGRLIVAASLDLIKKTDGLFLSANVPFFDRLSGMSPVAPDQTPFTEVRKIPGYTHGAFRWRDSCCGWIHEFGKPGALVALKKNLRWDAAAAAAELEKAMVSACAEAIELDPNLVIALSGGVDSTFVLHCMRKAIGSGRRLRAVILAYPGYACDETATAKAVADYHHADLEIVDATKRDFWPSSLSEFVGSSYFPVPPPALASWALAKWCRDNNCHSIVTGVGAEEGFSLSAESLTDASWLEIMLASPKMIKASWRNTAVRMLASKAIRLDLSDFSPQPNRRNNRQLERWLRWPWIEATKDIFLRFGVEHIQVYLDARVVPVGLSCPLGAHIGEQSTKGVLRAGLQECYARAGRGPTAVGFDNPNNETLRRLAPGLSREGGGCSTEVWVKHLCDGSLSSLRSSFSEDTA